MICSISAGSSMNQKRARGIRHEATGPYSRATRSRNPGTRERLPELAIPPNAESVEGPSG